MKQERTKTNKTTLIKKINKKTIKDEKVKKRTLKIFDYLNNGSQNAKKNRQ